MGSTSHQAETVPCLAYRYCLQGQVQGVGFRPFVYRLAHHYGIKGWVKNGMGQVIIHAEGEEYQLARFKHGLFEQAPAIAQPLLKTCELTEPENFSDFTIKTSNTDVPNDIHILPDLPLCDACLTELHTPADRRYTYPFINCSQCGPRYTIIKCLPYDRINTTMADFTFCAQCEQEYTDPTSRRFHAEPIACPSCGPQLSFNDKHHLIKDNEAAIKACMNALHSGAIIAVKGIGGYHLMCDASNDNSVLRLRERKQRPHKPLAVMFPRCGDDGLDLVRQHIVLDDTVTSYLLSNTRPIVLAAKQQQGRHQNQKPLSQHLAPGLSEIGCMLPYSPLHELILTQFGQPVVATSANISGEPVLTDNHELESRLAHVCDGYLHHNRPIQRPADDPLYRVIQHRARPLRTGRGNSPRELELPVTCDIPTLAVGGHMKNTIALAWDKRIVISPHIGDLHTLRSQQVFEQVIDDLQRLYDIQAERVVCDAHPAYASHRWAKQTGLPVTTVFHHYAHAAAVAGEFSHQLNGQENNEETNWLVFAWDGVGLGDDGSLWGGEALLGRAGHWQRRGSMRAFRLSGGDKVSREPWRSALALCWETGHDWAHATDETDLLHQAWQQDLNTGSSSAAGRLFDAAAALIGVNHISSFEGQAPMLLEALASSESIDGDAIKLDVVEDQAGVWRIDWAPLLPMLTDTRVSKATRAYHFHLSLAQALATQAKHIREQHGNFVVGLSGGVFQNRLLCELVIPLLEQEHFRVYLPHQIPVNDAGLCYGQVIETIATDH